MASDAHHHCSNTAVLPLYCRCTAAVLPLHCGRTAAVRVVAALINCNILEIISQASIDR